MMATASLTVAFFLLASNLTDFIKQTNCLGTYEHSRTLNTIFKSFNKIKSKDYEDKQKTLMKKIAKYSTYLERPKFKILGVTETIQEHSVPVQSNVSFPP